MRNEGARSASCARSESRRSWRPSSSTSRRGGALVISHVQVAREDGILVALQLTLSQLASIRVYQGDLEAAEGVVGECEAISPIAAGKELTVEESYRDALGCPAS